MSSRSLFITATDTESGKTLIGCALLKALNELGEQTLALKPVAAGCEQTPQGLRNSDAEMLQKFAGAKLAYDQINPYALEAAIAPHIAAQQTGMELSSDAISSHCRRLINEHRGITIIEGAGGWLLPLNDGATLADVCATLGCPVIMVVNIRLGCLNHALLTAQAIRHSGCELIAWLANFTSAAEDERVATANINTLRERLPAKLIGRVPFLPNPEPAAVQPYLDSVALVNALRGAS